MLGMRPHGSDESTEFYLHRCCLAFVLSILLRTKVLVRIGDDGHTRERTYGTGGKVEEKPSVFCKRAWFRGRITWMGLGSSVHDLLLFMCCRFGNLGKVTPVGLY